jgi:superfamily II DNA helicase RecQ
MLAHQFQVPSVTDMKTIVHSKFGITPCTWQLQLALHQLERKNVFMISLTGSGKMFMFWIPLLFNDNGIILIVTPLNILGEKTHNEAKMLGFLAYNLSTENATDEAFNVGACHLNLAMLMLVIHNRTSRNLSTVL